MSVGSPMIIEGLVAVLLLFTILYCVKLNRSITQLKGQEKTLKTTIAELITATDTAERAIAGLKATVKDADKTLGERLRAAEKFSTDIEQDLEVGESILDRLAQIASLRLASAASKENKPAAPDTRKIMAAAKAFAERAHSRKQSHAA